MGVEAHRLRASAGSVQDLPVGVVTFVFTDIEGSTKLLQRTGTAYVELLAAHRRLIRSSFTSHGGQEVDTQGDSFFYAFSSSHGALEAVIEAQRELAAYPWPDGDEVRVRMGVHVGEPLLVDGHYVGLDVHRAARISSAAHGAQVIVSAPVRDRLDGETSDDFGFADLGEHRLKDLAEPERLLQLTAPGLEEQFPPIRSLSPPTNLPHRVRALVGREREVEELRTMLTGPSARLVTITGPGGTGKTRLAVATAHGLLEDFAHGAFLVDLTQVHDADRVVPAVAGALGLVIEGGQPAVDVVAAHIVDRRILLVLDNFEHVVDGAHVLARLVRACPRLHVLVTSRRVLSLEDEQEYPLAPMQLPVSPSLEDVRRSESGRLFEERAQLSRPEFELNDDNAAAVAELCRLLDGLPLAIELAAAWTKLLAPVALLERLGDRLVQLTADSRDLPERHRSLRSTIAWSYDLLSAEEQQQFSDLAVLRGGGRLDGVEAVCSDGGDALALLTSLVDHSLVRLREDDDGQSRFIMLETLREYADERLREHPDRAAEVERRHGDFYAEVCLEARRAALDGRPDYAPITRDEDNVRAALTYWLERAGDDPEAADHALQVTGGIGSYWYQHSQAAEGSDWLQRALDAARKQGLLSSPTEMEADALRWLGVLAEQQLDFGRSRMLLEQSMALYDELGNASRVAACLNSLGVVARSSGDVVRAEELLLEAVRIRRERNEDLALTSSLNNLGIIYLDRGDCERALEIFTENLARDRANNDEWGAACTSLNLAVAHLAAGSPDEAQPLIRSCLTSYDELGDLDLLIGALEAGAGLAAAREQWKVGLRLGAAATRGRQVLSVPIAAVDLLHLERWMAQSAAGLPPETAAAARDEGAAMTVEQAVGYALTEVAGG
jgi:predicted ATPase/class 3 adenylate cyclase